MPGDELLSSTTNMADVALLRLYLDLGAKSVFNEDIQSTFTNICGPALSVGLLVVAYIQYIAAVG
jgi:hypothetical protein